MGKIRLQELVIKLNGSKSVYRSGEQIDGICVIDINGQLDLKNVRLRMIGQADVRWNKTKWVTSSNDRQSRTLTYIQSTTFLDQTFDVSQSAKQPILQKGVHHIPFRFQLPEEIPNSFKGNCGHIRYWIEAEIEKSLLSWNHESQTKFFVCSPLKATTDAPIVYRKSQDYCCCFIKKGSIDVEISIHDTCYNGGDFIPISFDVNNTRSFPIKIKATLIERHSFRAQNHRKDINQRHLSTDGPLIEACKQVNGTIRVPVPANTRPSVKCALIEVRYFVNIFINDKSSGLEFNFPVIVRHANSCEEHESDQSSDHSSNL